MKNLVKAKEEENKKGKGGERPVRNAKTPKVSDKKRKPERITTPKNKTKIEIKDKSAPHKIDKLNQNAKQADNKKFKFEKDKKDKEDKDKKEKEKKQELIEQKMKEKEKKMKEDKKKKEEDAKKRKEEKEKERLKKEKEYNKKKDLKGKKDIKTESKKDDKKISEEKLTDKKFPPKKKPEEKKDTKKPAETKKDTKKTNDTKKPPVKKQAKEVQKKERKKTDEKKNKKKAEKEKCKKASIIKANSEEVNPVLDLAKKKLDEAQQKILDLDYKVLQPLGKANVPTSIKFYFECCGIIMSKRLAIPDNFGELEVNKDTKVRYYSPLGWTTMISYIKSNSYGSFFDTIKEWQEKLYNNKLNINDETLELLRPFLDSKNSKYEPLFSDEVAMKIGGDACKRLAAFCSSISDFVYAVRDVILKQQNVEYMKKLEVQQKREAKKEEKKEEKIEEIALTIEEAPKNVEPPKAEEPPKREEPPKTEETAKIEEIKLEENPKAEEQPKQEELQKTEELPASAGAPKETVLTLDTQIKDDTNLPMLNQEIFS